MGGSGSLGGLTGLFVSALLAGTIVPEAMLIEMLVAGQHSPWLLVAVASAGNVLAAIINWLLGRGVERFSDRRWFPVKPARLERATRWFHRWGRWSLLLSWLPFVGETLTIVAGVLREPFWSFLALVTIARAGRYVIVAAITLGLL